MKSKVILHTYNYEDNVLNATQNLVLDRETIYDGDKACDISYVTSTIPSSKIRLEVNGVEGAVYNDIPNSTLRVWFFEANTERAVKAFYNYMHSKWSLELGYCQGRVEKLAHELNSITELYDKYLRDSND